MQEKITRERTKCIVFMLVAIELAIVLIAALHINAVFQNSEDFFGHLFKINYLHNSLKQGVLYPIYTEYWYNSMELFRYWPAFAYYVAALLQFCTAGDIFHALYLFIGFTYLLNMIGWLLFGKLENRYGMAFLAGNLFFFCPDNVRICLSEGNVPRIFITSLLPFAFYCVWKVLHYRERKTLVGLAGVIWLLTVTHFMIAAMTGVSIFIFCIIYSIMNKRLRETALITLDLVCGYLMAGFFLIPGLTGGGITSQNSEASVSTISQWAQEAVKSLNPFYRYGQDLQGAFYFGIVIFLIAVLGIITADKRTGAGFITVVFIFMSTTTTASAVVRLLPMSQVFWMQRFVPMAMCIFFFSLILWDRLRKFVVFLFMLGMVYESIIAVELLTEPTIESAYQIAEQEVSEYLLPEAAELTKNRLGLLDSSTWGSEPSWYLSKDMDQTGTLYSFGWAYQGAETIDSIVSINEAAENAFYEYAFDRMLELGDDVILASKSWLQVKDEEALHLAAQRVGYSLIEENDKAWLYQYKGIEGSFGIIKNYDNLAIGKHARVICYLYPTFGYGESICLDDYTLEDLCEYDKIYLSGFTYEDKQYAEKLLKNAADNGVEIFVEIQHIPMDKLSGKAEFLDVYAQYVSFTEKFPVLSTGDGSQFKLDFKTAGYDVWNTAYVSGASERVKAAYYDNSTTLTYVAKNGNPNITFLGFNPLYYYQENRIPELLTFLNEIFDEIPGEVCDTEIVPIKVEYESDKITVVSEKDQVNTGIAALDCFQMQGGIEKNSQNSLLLVNRGTTVYDVRYSDFTLGTATSVIGLIGSLVFWLLFVFRKGGDKHETVGSNNDVRVGIDDTPQGAGNI